MLEDKFNRLKQILGSLETCLVAYSGGVDSVLLAYVAWKVLGKNSLAIIADSPSLPRRELREAVEIAKDFGFALEVVRTKEFENDRYLSNPENRCYFCKQELFSTLAPIAAARGFKAVIYGENASDLGDHRPGSTAANEFRVLAPLKDCGLTKQEVRELSAQFGLPTSEKPQLACLSSRIPYGEPVTVEKLGLIEKAEDFLRDLGFKEVRVRHHQLQQGRFLARLELGESDFVMLLSPESRMLIFDRLLNIGYQHVAVDLRGYRRGSLNEGIQVVSAPRTVRFSD